jgi:hypothetical protein
MDFNVALDAFPLWLLFLATVLVVCLAVELGYRVGNYRRTHGPEKEAPVGAMVAAMLGLLAFLLAFVFGMAASRFEQRRQTVLDDANAIGTTYLRAALLPEPQKAEIRRLLRQYVDVRLAGIQLGNQVQALDTSEDLQNQIWSQLVAVAAQDPHSVITGTFIQSLNEMIDLHSTRVMVGLRSRIPGVIWIVLYLVVVLTMGTMGFQEGLAGTRRSLASLAVVLTFAIVMFLILDLDRPFEGLLKTSQQSMLDLQASMRANSP